MKKVLSVMSMTIGLLALVSLPALTQTFPYGTAACCAGPGSFVTGDTVVTNGLNYYAIVGTAGDDVLCGGDGADTVDGGPGFDVVCGGDGPSSRRI